MKNPDGFRRAGIVFGNIMLGQTLAEQPQEARMGAAQMLEEDEDLDQGEENPELAGVRDKDATVKLIDHDQAIYTLFDAILRESHQRLLLDPHTRKLNIAGGEAPSYAIFAKLNWHGDEATGRVPRAVAEICKESDFRLHGYELKILVNWQVWEALKAEHMDFVADEVWQSIEPQRDKQGRQRFDENERRIFKRSKPDVQTYSAVVRRRGAPFVEIDALIKAAAQAAPAQTVFDFRVTDKPEPAKVVDTSEFEAQRAKRAAAQV
jgi:hypothetical protein